MTDQITIIKAERTWVGPKGTIEVCAEFEGVRYSATMTGVGASRAEAIVVSLAAPDENGQRYFDAGYRAKRNSAEQMARSWKEGRLLAGDRMAPRPSGWAEVIDVIPDPTAPAASEPGSLATQVADVVERLATVECVIRQVLTLHAEEDGLCECCCVDFPCRTVEAIDDGCRDEATGTKVLPMGEVI